MSLLSIIASRHREEVEYYLTFDESWGDRITITSKTYIEDSFISDFSLEFRLNLIDSSPNDYIYQFGTSSIFRCFITGNGSLRIYKGTYGGFETIPNFLSIYQNIGFFDFKIEAKSTGIKVFVNGSEINDFSGVFMDINMSQFNVGSGSDGSSLQVQNFTVIGDYFKLNKGLSDTVMSDTSVTATILTTNTVDPNYINENIWTPL